MRAKIFILTLFISIIFADTIWVRWFDTFTDELGYGVAARLDKILQVGTFLADSNYDPLATIYNQNGNLLRVIPIGLPLDNEAISAAFDNQGNFYLTGYTYQFRKLLLKDLIDKRFYAQEYRSFLIKFDSLGIEEWRKIEENKIGLGVTVDLANNAYQSGTYYYGDFDFFIKKYSPTGETIWERILDNNLYDFGYRVKVDNDGNIVAVGFTGDGNSFELLIWKLTPNGNTIWQRTYDFSPIDFGINVDIDFHNNIFVVGSCGDYYLDFLVLKCDENGNPLWSRTFDYSDYDQAIGVTTGRFGDVGQQNNIYLCGYGGNLENYDLIILCYNTNGNLIGQEIYDFSLDDVGCDLTTDSVGNPIVSGYAVNNINYTYDFLLMKLAGQAKILERDNLKKKREII
ncbi:MAG: hypothetical protein N2323_03235, partial [candidate division WOR-3 bacterium]|nr:hypothetical protein [candidate division WOR-3 bacterium]